MTQCTRKPVTGKLQQCTRKLITRTAIPANDNVNRVSLGSLCPVPLTRRPAYRTDWDREERSMAPEDVTFHGLTQIPDALSAGPKPARRYTAVNRGCYRRLFCTTTWVRVPPRRDAGSPWQLVHHRSVHSGSGWSESSQVRLSRTELIDSAQTSFHR